MATLTFLGAARTVTGSKYLLEVDGQRILIDCGLFQGLKELRLRNWAPLPVPPESIDARRPHARAHRPLAAGCRGSSRRASTGPIYCTGGTADLCKLVLPDAAHLQEEDAKFANRRGFSKHHAGAAALHRGRRRRGAVAPAAVGVRQEDRRSATGFEVEFINAGHLLGSAYVLLTRAERSGAARCCSAAISAATTGPILPDPVARRRCRRAAARIHLRRSRPSRRRRRRDAGADRQRDGTRSAAR